MSLSNLSSSNIKGAFLDYGEFRSDVYIQTSNQILYFTDNYGNKIGYQWKGTLPHTTQTNDPRTDGGISDNAWQSIVSPGFIEKLSNEGIDLAWQAHLPTVEVSYNLPHKSLKIWNSGSISTENDYWLYTDGTVWNGVGILGSEPEIPFKQIIPQNNIIEWSAIATEGQNQFTVPYDFTNISLFINGVLQNANTSGYVVNGSTITLNGFLKAGDDIHVYLTNVPLSNINYVIQTDLLNYVKESDLETNYASKDNLASTDVGDFTIDYVHLSNSPEVPFTWFLSSNSNNVNNAIKSAAASGKTVIFPYNGEYEISINDIPFSKYTRFVGPPGGYVLFKITNTVGTYGTFDLRTTNGLGGGAYNTFKNISFRYPNQKRTIATGESPTVYPPIFHGGAYESRFENLDIGNAYYGFRLGGDNLGTASRVTLTNIIGSPIFYGISLEQVRDIPVISNIRWNYNYLDASVYSYDSNIKQWMSSNATAYQFGRLDWATITNIFAFGYLYGIYTRSLRYTGSADRLRFIGCFMDHCIYPVNLRNFQNRVDFIGCGLTSEDGSAFTLVEPSKIYIYNTGDLNAEVCFTNCTINGSTSNAIFTGTNLRLNSCNIYDFGTDSTSTNVRNGIMLLTSGLHISIDNTMINANKSSYSRCIYDGGYDNNFLSISGGSQLLNATVENIRWNAGANSSNNREVISIDSIISGATSDINSRGSIGFFTHKNVYESSSIPTSGTYNRGEYIKNTTPSILGTAGALYTIKGWFRITTGSSHVINVDWVVDKIYTGT